MYGSFNGPQMSKERLEAIKKSGDIYELIQRISKEANVSEDEVKMYLSYYFETLSSNQRTIMGAHYKYDKSIEWIRWNYGVKSYTKVEDTLERATVRLIKAFKTREK